GFDPTQTPFEQASVCVHALPSLQGVPSARAACVHAPPLQRSDVHASPSSHELGQSPSASSESSQLTVAPEPRSTWAAAMAPVNLDVLTVTSASGATKSARTVAPEPTLTALDASK